MNNMYLWLKWAHIISSTVLLGTGAGIAFLFMRDLAGAAAANGSTLSPQFHRYYRIWFVLGWPAAMGVLTIFGLMIFKP